MGYQRERARTKVRGNTEGAADHYRRMNQKSRLRDHGEEGKRNCTSQGACLRVEGSDRGKAFTWYSRMQHEAGVGTRTEHYGLKQNWLSTRRCSLSSLKGKRDGSAPSIQVKWKSNESEG